MTKRNLFKGMGVALVTPFRPDSTVDYEALEALVEMQLARGVDFMCVLGTTAETPCLNSEEKKQIKDFVVEKIAGRVPVLLGCGGNNTAEVVNHLQHDDFTGVDGVLIVCPYYNKPSQEGLYQHFKSVSEATELPVVLYNVPGRTGVNLHAETTLRLANDCNNVVAIKEASGNIAQIEKILREKPDDFDVLSGDDAITYELLTLGAVGVISVIGNAYPEEFAQMVHLLQAGHEAEALSIHRKMSELFALMSIDGNPAGVKSLLALQGRIQNKLRLPLVPARKETLHAIQKQISLL